MLPKIANHPSLTYADDIAAICQPLQKLNINYFAHATINKDKQFAALSTHPAYVQHYLEKNVITLIYTQQMSIKLEITSFGMHLNSQEPLL